MIITAEGFTRFASALVFRTNDKKDRLLNDREFKAFFGRAPAMIADAWNSFDAPAKAQPKHLLWMLMYLKLYNSLDVMAIMCQTTKPTYIKWVDIWIECIANDCDKYIRWDKRFRNVPNDVVIRASVDGTDFPIEEPFPFDKTFKSPRMECSALKYEVCISIYSGDIVWIYGPHPGGKNDKTIFKEHLVGMLEDGELLEADRGYIGLEEWIHCPDDCDKNEEYLEKAWIRAKHETCNRRFNEWSILKSQYRGHNRVQHRKIFRCIATLTQIDIDSGNVLFQYQPTKTGKKKTEYVLGATGPENFLDDA